MIVTFIPYTGYSTALENRVMPQCMADFSLQELYDYLRANCGISDDKASGDFLIPAEFETKDYIYARDKSGAVLYDNEGNPCIARCAENVKRVTMIAGDYDDGMTISEAEKRFKGLSYILYTSYNHLVDGKTHKFRMFFPLTGEGATPDQIRNRKVAIHEYLGPVDQTTLYVSRGFYVPSVNADYMERFYSNISHGEVLDINDFDEVIPKPYVPNQSGNDLDDKDMQDLKNALINARIDTYERWWQMIQSMKSVGFSEADVLDVSADNINHSSSSTGVKDARLVSSIYNNCVVQDGGTGKLISIIRDGGDPTFRVSISAGGLSNDALDNFIGRKQLQSERTVKTAVNKLDSLRRGRR